MSARRRIKQRPRYKAINMEPQRPLRDQECQNWDFFLRLPNPDRTSLNLHKMGQQQMQQPLFEFSGACAGCGETPYIKLVTQLFGDRLIVANATGCSSIYGGNLPTTPWTHNNEGKGPAWSNSLFEDNAEFGLGFRVAIDKQAEFAAELLQQLATEVDIEQAYIQALAEAILHAGQQNEADLADQQERVALLKQWLTDVDDYLHTHAHVHVHNGDSLQTKIHQLQVLGRHAGAQECLDHWRGWLGLRYWLRRIGSRPGQWP